MSLASYRAAPSRGVMIFIAGSKSTPNALSISAFPEIGPLPIFLKTLGTIILQQNDSLRRAGCTILRPPQACQTLLGYFLSPVAAVDSQQLGLVGERGTRFGLIESHRAKGLAYRASLGCALFRGAKDDNSPENLVSSVAVSYSRKFRRKQKASLVGKVYLFC